MTETSRSQRDLIALVADYDIRAAVLAILNRPDGLGIRPIDVTREDIRVHANRDPGCLLTSHEMLRLTRADYAHALVIFDWKGCGRDGDAPGILEARVEDALARSGWGNQSAAVVIDPELEIWVWSDSPHVAHCLGWAGRRPNLRTWLERKNLWLRDEAKPSDPERAFRESLREVHKPASAAVYGELAALVGLSRCRDHAFCRLRSILQKWFPPLCK